MKVDELNRNNNNQGKIRNKQSKQASSIAEQKFELF